MNGVKATPVRPTPIPMAPMYTCLITDIFEVREVRIIAGMTAT